MLGRKKTLAFVPYVYHRVFYFGGHQILEDKLKKCAISYEKLLNKEYIITAKKKKVTLEITLYFRKEHFFHLVGLNKLTDIQVLRNNKTKIFEKILNGKITYEIIKKSVHFNDMAECLEYFPSLENILDDYELMIKFNSNKTKSKIKAKYIIYFIRNDIVIHYFVDESIEENKYFGRTFFTRKDKAYLCDNPYVIIKKEKIIV